MEFKDELKNYIKRLENIKDTLQTEEATKMSLIVPFFQLLGYDVFNPLEFCPEYTADIGIKKGEKVDYAILIDQKPVILVEAKSVNKKLDKHSSQLFRYFVASSAKFAILTNGIEYKFYTDLDETNKMDKEAFYNINLLNIKDSDIDQLGKFKKQNLNISEIMDSASLLKYNSLFKEYIKNQFEKPTDDFVKLLLQPVYKGAKTQAVVEKFRPIVEKALNDYINEILTDKIQAALNTTVASSATTVSDIQTDAHWEILSEIKNIFKNVIDPNKISLKHTGSYTAVLYERNVRKWICRLSLSGTQKLLILPDANKNEVRIPISGINDLNNFSGQMIEVVQRYSNPSPKEVLYTLWGKYEMPDPYKIFLGKGPRKDLKKI